MHENIGGIAGNGQTLAESGCERTEFICSDLNCVSFALRCDGSADCPDSSDEVNCPGSYSHFDSCANLKTQKQELHSLFKSGATRRHNLRATTASASTSNFNVMGIQIVEMPLMRSLAGLNVSGKFLCDLTSGKEKIVSTLKRRVESSYGCQQSQSSINLMSNLFHAVVSGQCSNETEWECLDQSRCIDVRRRCDGYQDCRDLSDENDQLCRDSEYVGVKIEFSDDLTTLAGTK